MNCMRPTELLNSVCQSLGLSDSYAELARQRYEMSSFVGMPTSEVKRIFVQEIREDLQQFANNLDDVEWGHPHVAIRMEAAVSLGLIKD